MRMFVAVQPPLAAVEDLAEFWEPRRTATRAGSGLRWSDPEQWHYTLAFLPAVPDRVVDDLVEALDAAAARRTSFRMRVAGGGAFPGVADAKVVWAGAETDERGVTELDRLAAGVRAGAAHVGAAPDGGRLRPHLTLGRLARARDVVAWVRVLDTYRGPWWDVDEVALVASHLGEGPRRRPRYEVVRRAVLAAGPERGDR
ncbi:RNA 2',3'-cyclic phosphodiesterase [Nocardioides massiliensis]|uniref:RNA 2',3'-cyclic phosphodiesterase n=1 Tax=Nocardioides massiliensis TaxID=1325935 RepID=A0ABT9NL20_9ACTN|nr:RNA 2',3'-cyclic phosphodiesterase [Nocardioides massiliensis]MDP9821103.1 2'-5' RNA ligase [Nocardioides massiliensis]